MNKVSNGEGRNATSSESLVEWALDGLGRVAVGAITGVPAPLSKDQPREAISFFDASAPELPLAAILDQLDAPFDEKMVADKMSHIEIHKTED